MAEDNANANDLGDAVPPGVSRPSSVSADVQTKDVAKGGDEPVDLGTVPSGVSRPPSIPPEERTRDIALQRESKRGTIATRLLWLLVAVVVFPFLFLFSWCGVPQFHHKC